MQVQLRSGAHVYLDSLIVEIILNHLGAKELAAMSTVCRVLRNPAQQAAYRGLVQVVKDMQGILLRHCQQGSWISQLREWETVRKSCVMWLQAEEAYMTLVTKGEDKLVRSCIDRSGHGHSASMVLRMPTFKPKSLNGCGTIQFDGTSVLKTHRFVEPLQQPVTLMIVALARGDTTIVDSLGPSSSRFEICHGYPTGWNPSPEICMTASGHESVPKHSLRGSTRGNGQWHVYTAIFDQRRSEVFVDGHLEASGKNVGTNALDGLTIGCDHNGVFFLNGALAEIRVFHCHLPTSQRIQTEAAVAVRYGISYSCAPPPKATPPKTRRRHRCYCVPRTPLRMSN